VTRLKVNPTVKDLTNNAFDPVIEYAESMDQPPLLYIRLTTDINHVVTTPAKLDLIIDLNGCDGKPAVVNLTT
jgi:hypothetical protein